ncbi:MAG: hypothetical protein IK095_03400 [Oscillospiraceae bacterium]|nr:hypothetical protein [Oscillospiraceae bacterium]
MWMMDVPDPAWKRDPDIVADESFFARYATDDLEEEEDNFWALMAASACLNERRYAHAER